MASLNKAPTNLTSVSTDVPNWIDAVYLDDGNAHSYTVPSTAKHAIFSADDAVWFATAATAAVPTNDVTDGTGSLRVPTSAQFNVAAGTTLSFIRENASTTIVSIGVYS